MEVIAQRGEQFLVREGDRGRIYDRKRNKLYPPIAVDSIIARGYWEPVDVLTAEEVEKELRVRSTD